MLKKNLTKNELLTALQKSEEDLEDLESYINDLFNFAPFSLCATTHLGIIININLSFKELTGYTEIEIVGQNVSVLFPKNEWTRIKKEIYRKEVFRNRETNLLKKGQQKITVSLSSTSRKDLAGNKIGYSMAFYDITELKKLQEDLEKRVEERTEQLSKRLDELEKFRKVTIGRELRMSELKKEIRELKEKLKNC